MNWCSLQRQLRWQRGRQRPSSQENAKIDWLTVHTANNKLFGNELFKLFKTKHLKEFLNQKQSQRSLVTAITSKTIQWPILTAPGVYVLLHKYNWQFRSICAMGGGGGGGSSGIDSLAFSLDNIYWIRHCTVCDEVRFFFKQQKLLRNLIGL